MAKHSEKPVVCAYCGEKLPEPGYDCYCIAYGHISAEPACTWCIKSHRLKIVELVKP